MGALCLRSALNASMVLRRFNLEQKGMNPQNLNKTQEIHGGIGKLLKPIVT